MKNSSLRNALIFSLCAAVCFLFSCFAQGQESWGATGAGSAWQAGSSKAAAPVAQTNITGASSRWSAGVGSIPSQRQTGGLWQESSSTDGAALIKESEKKSAPGTNPLAKPSGFASVGASPRIGRVGAVPNKVQVSNKLQARTLSNGSHALNHAGASNSLHSGIARNGASGAIKQRTGAVANGHQRQSFSQRLNGTKASSSGSNSSMPSDSAMKALSDSSSPTDSLGSELQSSPDDQPR